MRTTVNRLGRNDRQRVVELLANHVQESVDRTAFVNSCTFEASLANHIDYHGSASDFASNLIAKVEGYGRQQQDGNYALPILLDTLYGKCGSEDREEIESIRGRVVNPNPSPTLVMPTSETLSQTQEGEGRKRSGKATFGKPVQIPKRMLTHITVVTVLLVLLGMGWWFGLNKFTMTNPADEAEQCQQRGEYIKMYEVAMKMWQGNNQKPLAALYVGISYEKTEKWDMARQWYETAVDLAPDSSEAHRRLGDVYRKLNRIWEAQQQYKMARDSSH